MSAKTLACTSDPTTREPVSETKAAEKRRTPQSARAQDFFGLRRFSAALVFLMAVLICQDFI
jgi:hypothetical protein